MTQPARPDPARTTRVRPGQPGRLAERRL